MFLYKVSYSFFFELFWMFAEYGDVTNIYNW